MNNMFSFFNLNYWLNQCLGTVFSHPVSSGVSNGKFSQKVIWGKKNRSCSGTRMSVKSVSPFNLISFLFMSQMEDSYLFWKSSHAFNCLQYLSFLKCFHPTLFCSFNTDFKCLLSVGKCSSFPSFQWSCESNKLDHFTTSFVVTVNSLV